MLMTAAADDDGDGREGKRNVLRGLLQ